MPVESSAELFEALGRGGMDDLLGTAEAEWLDFKSEPYKLDTARGIADLVADVAAFANATGGVVLLGVHEAQLEDSRQKVASKIRGINAAYFHEEQVRAVVRRHVQPLVRLEVRRYPVEDTDRQLVAIIVTGQPEHERPCIVDRISGSDGVRIPHAMEWPTRHGSDTHWETSGRVQQLLSTGLRPAAAGTGVEYGSGLGDVAESQRELLSQQEEWDGWGRIIVQAIPRDPTRRISDFFGDFAAKVQRWRGIRVSGFDLGVDELPLRRMSRAFVASDGRRFVAIDRMGVMTAAAHGTPDMLGWANHQGVPWSNLDKVVANPYVVVEFSSEAVRFAAEAISPEVVPSSWTYRVIGELLAEPTPLYLRPRPKRFLMHMSDHPPLETPFNLKFRLQAIPGETRSRSSPKSMERAMGLDGVRFPLLRTSASTSS